MFQQPIFAWKDFLFFSKMIKNKIQPRNWFLVWGNLENSYNLVFHNEWMKVSISHDIKW